MTPTEHINKILSAAARDALKKYEAGQEEHGGKLWRKPIMNYIGEEIIDMVVYWYTFKDQWKELQDDLSFLELQILDSPDVPKWVQTRVTRLVNLMQIGNPEGEWEEERDASQ